ncbi:MAG: hypothetical protein GQ570_03915 [Helicobacteraceae bacterium]|nr:hypothetical protein [Helicobacteraceae bacterium]
MTLQDSKVFVEHHTEADDSVAIFPATQTDTQTDLSGTERLYGCGQLAADVAPAVASITVATEDVLYNMFRNGDKIRISDKTDINDNGGSEEYVTINGVPSYAGDVATIAITPVLSAAYAAANTRVSSVIEVGDIGTVVTAASVTSASTGAYDDTTYPIALSNVGCIEQDWTLTFTDATSFTVSGSVVGAIDTGTTSTQTVPVNPDFSQPYFTLEANGFSGGFLAGDTITFTTSPAAYPIWYRRDVPAASASLAANSVTIVVDGEST